MEGVDDLLRETLGQLRPDQRHDHLIPRQEDVAEPLDELAHVLLDEMLDVTLIPHLRRAGAIGPRAGWPLQEGTLDFGITPSLEKPGGGYDQSPPWKYFVEFEGDAHLAWADIGNPATHPDIVAYSVAFLNHYVNGKPAQSLLTQPLPGVALFRYDSELGQRGESPRR
jgi:hypothetical protein